MGRAVAAPCVRVLCAAVLVAVVGTLAVTTTAAASATADPHVCCCHRDGGPSIKVSADDLKMGDTARHGPPPTGTVTADKGVASDDYRIQSIFVSDAVVRRINNVRTLAGGQGLANSAVLSGVADWHTAGMVVAGAVSPLSITPQMLVAIGAQMAAATTSSLVASGPADVVADVLVNDLLTRAMPHLFINWPGFNAVGCSVLASPPTIHYLTCVFGRF